MKITVPVETGLELEDCDLIVCSGCGEPFSLCGCTFQTPSEEITGHADMDDEEDE